MFCRVPRPLFLLIGLAALVVVLANADSACAVQKMPQFSLSSVTDGAKISSDSFRGKVLIVNFWATWCPPCRKEIPTFIELQKRYGDKGFSVIGISLDESGAKPVRKMVNKLDVNYPMVMGNSAVARDFGGVGGIPVTFVVNRDGDIVERFDGYVGEKVIVDELERLIR